ncbi:unnamed protein product [Bursaphelenchus xylophilus]|uniref:(pine wood nematode) hypothetical protein n=1 Tax=Bursaphelenchus xylophilus TaxID=6326 RepID=A0A1I7RQZ6_BURXY|nr:unnamed protein product [Bursaphelenchus xylophilus]CAG9130768.1 unnamed protein product [Bursaphelenchus xylophilus]
MSSRSHKSSHGRRYDEKKGDRVRERMEKALESASISMKAEWEKEKTKNTKHTHVIDLTVEEKMERQRRIEDIEEGGFQPATFFSGQGTSRCTNKGKEDESQKNHDGAMFGAMWKSKEISKKLDKSTKPKRKEEGISPDVIPLPPQSSDLSDFPLAQQWLNLPVDVREQNWMKRFHEQRRELFEGQI